ncbi:hypothetical protein SLS60_008369 [Paraconiothyrium brasiliense]|uniref:Uncharacterized protein n=1 Tax=Paraconiothyrium brasiliense TaxID=300254 RepID=A0ABR3R1L4_9PLEO
MTSQPQTKMDACYGKNIHGYSWADDDEDDFNMESSRATATTYGYYSTTTDDDNADDDDDEEQLATDADFDNAPTFEESGVLFHDDHDIPPRPATPEPTLRRGYNSDSDSDSDSDLDDEEHPLPPRPSTPEPTLPSAAPQSFRKLPGGPAFYLQTPFPPEYWIPPGLPPNTLRYLDWKQGRAAYEELLWEAGGYFRGWRKVKEERGVGWGECMLLRGSGLRGEVRFEEEVETTLEEELEGEDIWKDEEVVVEEWGSEVQDDIEEEGEVPAKGRDDENAGIGEKATVGVHGENDMPMVVNDPSRIKFPCDDELTDERPKPEELTSSSPTMDMDIPTPPDTDSNASGAEKRDSLHDDSEDHDTGLFSDDEDAMHSTTPDSSVIVSTDDELEAVQDSRFIVPGQEKSMQVGDSTEKMLKELVEGLVEEAVDSLSATSSTDVGISMEEGRENRTHALPGILATDVQNSQVNGTTQEKKDPPLHALHTVTPIAHVKGLRLFAIEKVSAIMVAGPTNSHAKRKSSATPSHPEKTDEDLARRLGTLYRIHQASKKHCHRTGSSVLHALARLPKA